MKNINIENSVTSFINFKILYLNYFKSGIVFNHVMHSHAFTELFYVCSGEGYIQFENDRKLFVQEGDFVIINPHTEHCEYSLSNPSMGFFVYGISGIAFQQKGEAVPFLSLCRKDREEESEYIEKVYDNILEELSDLKEMWENMAHAYLEQLIIYATRVLGAEICREQYCGSDAIQRAEEYICSHLEARIDLDDLARFACVNKCTLINLFKREYGLTPMRYIMQKRVYKAIDLISTTEKSLNVIIGECGFINSAHFYQVFKRITGATPSEYKKQSLK